MRTRGVVRVAGLAAGALALAAPFLLRGTAPPVLLNFTESLPGRIFVRVDREARVGDVVAVCLPEDLARFALEREYVARGLRCPGGSSPLLKRVAALAGSEVRYDGERLVVDGEALEASAIRQGDSRGRAMPVLRAPGYIVGEGEVLLMNAHPLSFDSRYFGAVSIASLLGVYRRVLGVDPSPGVETPVYLPSVALRRRRERRRLTIPSVANRPEEGSQGFQPLAKDGTRNLLLEQPDRRPAP